MVAAGTRAGAARISIVNYFVRAIGIQQVYVVYL